MEKEPIQLQTEIKYIDPETKEEQPLDKVYFRGEGTPYKLEVDDEENLVMTRKPLEKITYEYKYTPKKKN